MAFRSLQFIPGLNAQFTPTLNRTGWVGELIGNVPTTNLIRWPASSNGLPEVVGGWTAFLSGGQTLVGVCRGLHSWATLLGLPTVAAGTNSHLYIVQGGLASDITPLAHTSSLTGPFTTTLGSRTVVVTDAGYAPNVGGYLEISGASAVGGITLSGEYVVLTTPTGTTYTIQAATPATSGATGGGTPTIKYLIPTGAVDEGPGLGWGIGGWGLGTWGTARSQTTVTTAPGIWQMDNWGEDLAAVRGPSPIYFWDSTGTPPDPTVRALSINTIAGSAVSPPECNGVLVAPQQQQMIAWGISIPDPVGMTWGAQDPMLIGWSDFSNYQVWFASATNAAGSFRINDGSMIQQILKAQGQMLVWTDTALFSMQFINVPLVYGFQQLGSACGLVSPKAAVTVGSQAFWWSRKGFFQYNGTVIPLPCPISDLCLGNLNAGQKLKICASSNTEYSEVQWEFPSAAGLGENDSYVSYNWVNGTWGFGTLSNGVPIGRTARIDNGVIPYPLAADAQGNLWQHESTYTAGGGAMPWAAQSGFADMAEGEEFAFVDQLIPDAVQLVQGSAPGNVGITVLAQNYPTDTPRVFGPFNAGATVERITFRARSRQIAVSFANTNNTPGLFWRLGRVRVRAAADGRR